MDGSTLIHSKLSLLSSSLDKDQAFHTLKTLRTVLNNVKSDPSNDKYWQLRKENKTFGSKVWRHEAARDVLMLLGWEEAGDLVVLQNFASDSFEIALAMLGDLIGELDPAPANGLDSAPKQAVNVEYQKRMELLKESKRKEEEHKRKIAVKIEADRKEASSRKTKPSRAREIKFGSNVARFEDIGVDLNGGGG